jgi:hypothetical protein
MALHSSWSPIWGADRFELPADDYDGEDTASNFTRFADGRKAYTQYAPKFDWWEVWDVDPGHCLMDGFNDEDRAVEWLEEYAEQLEADNAQTWRAA